MVNGLNVSEFNKRLYSKNIKQILQEYKSLISEFIIHISDSVKLHDKSYYEFIIKRGLDTLLHCFKMLLLYTKNIGQVSYYCKKALCYYVEFIGQIAQDSNSYLQLNTKDATLFVYKKTIFEIDNDFRKKYVFNLDEKETLELITLNIEIFNSLVFNQLKLQNKDINNEKDVATILTNIVNCFNRLETGTTNIKADIENSKIIQFFVNNIVIFCTDVDNYIEICNTFIKKIKKKHISIYQLTKCFYMDKCEERYNSLTTLKFINWIFQQST